MKDTNLNTHNAIRNTKIAILFTLIISCLMLPQAKAFAATTNQISQFGITWTFDRDYEYGQFANGDYWVIGPVTIIGITPASTVTDGRTINGSMLDPNSGQGFDSAGPSYSASKNVARPGGNDLSSGNPLVIQAGHSLVSSISPATVEGSYAALTDGAILTVLASAPDVNSFRPPYSGTDKTIRFNVSDLNYSILKSLTPTASAPSLQTAEGWFERPWFDWIYNGNGRFIHPSNNMPNYGRDIAVRTGDGALVLNLNYTNTQKQTLMVRYVQLGIDLYGVLINGGRTVWIAGGGHSHGRKLPILFAGTVLNDPNMKAVGSKSGDYLYSGSYGPGNEPPDYYHFGEDDQTFYVRASDVYSQPYTLTSHALYQVGHVKVTHDSNIVEGVGTSWLSISPDNDGYFGVKNDIEAYSITGRAYHIKSIDSNTQLTLTELYRGDTNQTGNAEYKISDRLYYGHGNLANYEDFTEFTDTDLGIPEWGIMYCYQPYTGSPQWTMSYRPLCSYSYVGDVLAAQIMGLKTLWNHNALFDYEDRWMTVGYIGGDRSLSTFAEEMWDTYRADYGPVWPGTNFLYGDVSGDADISAYDAALTAQAAVGLITLTPDQIKAADVSGNGEVSAYDAALIAQKAVKLIDKFPVE